MLDLVHDDVGEGFEAEKEEEGARALGTEQVAEQNGQVHGHNARVGKHHHGADVGLPGKIPLQMVTIGKAVVDSEQRYADQRAGDVGPGQVAAFGAEKHKVDQMEEAVVDQEEKRHLPPRGRGGIDRLVVHREILGGELPERQDSSPVEKSDDNALPPIDPHDDGEVPAFDQGKGHGGEVGEKKEKG